MTDSPQGATMNTKLVTDVFDGVLGFIFAVFKKGFKIGTVLTLFVILLLAFMTALITAVIK